ncbi:hypothetical protein BKA62DRAFT_695162 [Auriculariales sp. MPI-PUGE-AT-0066]|nr:hypothetical protein BKA62DRAFT_695162 [Auriculariales sp. MPI-PUGE-AT-0066]
MPSNVTVDDTSDEIIYTGTWDPNQYPSSLSFNGSHRLSYDSTATVTFKFKGIAVYLWYPLWPYLVNTTVTLDNTTSAVLDLTDYDLLDKPDVGTVETVLSEVRWSHTGLEDTEHTIVLTMVPDATYLVFDAVTYTVNYNIPTPGAQRARTIAIALGTSLALAALAAIVLFIYFWYFLKGSRRWKHWRRAGAHTRVQDSSFNLENEVEGFPKQAGRGSVWVEPTPPHLIPHPYSFSRSSTQTASDLDQFSPWVGLGPLASRVRLVDPDPFADGSHTSSGSWQVTPNLDDDEDQLNSAGTGRSARRLPPGAQQPYMFVSNRADDDDDGASIASSSSTLTRVQEGPYSITTKSDSRSRQS